jgi:peptide/nickel transport system substrate-binding protein
LRDEVYNIFRAARGVVVRLVVEGFLNKRSRGVRAFAVIALVLSVVVVSACSGVSSPTGSGNETLRIAEFAGVPTALSPFEGQGRFRATMENMYEPLAAPYRDTLDVKGVLAENWTVSADGTTYRFNLRKGVTFTDGTAFDAQSVKDSFEMFNKVAKSDLYPQLQIVKQVRVVDANTVEFVIDPTGFPFIQRINGLQIASSKAVAEHGTDSAWWTQNSAGTGAYKLDQLTPNDRLTISRNDKWWGPKPYFAKVVFLAVPEASTQQLMIEKGDVDMAFSLPPESFAKLRSDANLKVISTPGDRILNVELNTQRPPLNNIKLRKALAYAFDYAGLAQARQQDMSVAVGPVPPQYLGGWTPPNLINKQDLDKAKALLAEAGYKAGELELNFNYPAGVAQQQTSMEVLQASLAKIGVKANVKAVDFLQVFRKLQTYAADPVANAKEAEGIDSFTLLRNPFVPHVYSYISTFQLKQPYNYFAYTNERANQLFDQGNRATKPEDATNLYRQAVQTIVEDQPSIWTYIEKTVLVHRADIEGYYTTMFFPEIHVFTLKRTGK